MTDQEIISGLLARDEKITYEFFFVKCRPLMYSVINRFFPAAVNYDELINELYVNLMANDAQGLRTFSGKSSLYQWLKIVSYNYFSSAKKREMVSVGKETGCDPLDGCGDCALTDDGIVANAILEIKLLMPQIKDERRKLVLGKIMIEGMSYEELSALTGISVSNLYNIKRRALLDLAEIINTQEPLK